jgi:cytochrome c oxidase assembly protein subunit 15
VKAVAHPVALVTLAATFVLILFGGLVTNTGAALTVPDWPSTFGYNLLVFPWSRMVGGIFYEHSHRLIGVVVGLLTLGLAAALWRAGRRLRWLGLAAVVAVVAQGVLGGLRVVLVADSLAIVHGSLAQAFFGLLSAIAFLTSRAAERPSHGVDPSLRPLTIAAAVVVYVQIVLGALLTHAGWLALHLAGAVAVFAVLPVVTARLRRSDDPVAAPVARTLLILLGVQLVLGVGSYLARFSPIGIPGGGATALLLPVAHRLVASLILGATVVLAVRVASREPSKGATSRARPQGATAPSEPPPGSVARAHSGSPRASDALRLRTPAPALEGRSVRRAADVTGGAESGAGARLLSCSPRSVAASRPSGGMRSDMRNAAGSPLVSGHPRSVAASRPPFQWNE